MRTVIYPYKRGSESARLLAESLGAILINPMLGNRARRYTPRSGDFIINWGHGSGQGQNSRLRAILSQIEGAGLSNAIRILNKPENVAIASNKLSAFRALRNAGVAVPDFTTNPNEAVGWNTQSVYVRHRLTGHSGEGIEIRNRGENLPANAPLYVKPIQNNGEYRIHVSLSRVIGYTKKRRRNGEQPTDEQNLIRNLDNGWVFTRERLRRLDRIEDLAVRAVAVLGLDFGAVDIIMDENGDVFVLEVNTACGMSEATLAEYVEAFNTLRHA